MHGRYDDAYQNGHKDNRLTARAEPDDDKGTERNFRQGV